MKNRQLTNVALVEFVDEAESLLSYCKKENIDPLSISIIALSPKVESYLQRMNIPYEDTLKYFDNRDQEDIIVNTECIFSYYYEHLNGPVSIIEDFLLYTRFYVLHFQWLLKILDNVPKDGEISIITVKTPSIVETSPIMKDSERYLSLLSRIFCEKNNINYIEIPGNGSLDLNTPNKSTTFGKIYGFLGKLNFKKMEKFGDHKIIINSPAYNIGDLCHNIQKEHSRTKIIALGEMETNYKLIGLLLLQLLNLSPKKQIYYLPINVLTKKRTKKIDVIGQIEKSLEQNIFRYNDIDFSIPIQNKIKVALIPHLYNLSSQRETIRTIYSAFNPLMVMSHIGTGVGRVMGEVSNEFNIPSIFISHGSHKAPSNKIEHIELFNLCKGFLLSEFKYVTISSPFVERHYDYFKSTCPQMPAKAKVTGPLIFAKITPPEEQSINDERTRTIVHATTLKSRGVDRFYFIETNDEFYRSVNDLIDVVEEMADVKLVLRLHPGYPLSEKEIRNLLKPSNKLEISMEGPFQKVLESADLLVSYSSTAIEEALINLVPVVLFDRWKRYNHLDAPVVNEDNKDSCAYYATDKEELKRSIETLLDGDNSTRKDCYYKYVYKEDNSSSFYDLIENIYSEHDKEDI